MKIGILSDIHGDIECLELALDLFEVEGVQQVICAGDLVDRNYEGDAVVSRIQGRQIPTVQGNHDADPFDRHYLLDTTLAFLKQLPQEIIFEWNSHRVYMTHGAPGDNWEYVFPKDSPSKHYRLMNNTHADIIILGHTHIPMLININDGQCWIVNPGTVCARCAYDVPTCAILTIPEETDDVIRFEVFDLNNYRRIEPEYVEITTTTP